MSFSHFLAFRYSWEARIIFAIYSIGLLVGTYTHTRHLVYHGLFHHSAPMALGIYWDALTVIDPLAVLLLWWQPRVGIWLVISIMTSDISLNTHAYLMEYSGPTIANMVPLYLFDQALFGLFVFVTAPFIFRHSATYQLPHT